MFIALGESQSLQCDVQGTTKPWFQDHIKDALQDGTPKGVRNLETPESYKHPTPPE
jgi:hypothetical protein